MTGLPAQCVTTCVCCAVLCRRMQVVVALASQSHRSLSYYGLKRHFGDAAGVTKRCAASLFRQGGRDPVRARMRKLR